MKLRVRFGELRFVVTIGDENATVFTLKKAICSTVSVRDISLINISLNGTDIIGGDDVLLSSHGLVNSDLVYVISSAVPSQPATDIHNNDENRGNKVFMAQLVGMGFDEGTAERALVHVNNTTIDAALEFIVGSEQVQETANVNCGKPEINLSDNITKQTSHPSSTTANQLMSTSSSGSYKKTTTTSERINIPNPVFCRDGISTVLESMYDKASVNTQHEAMFVILHALMLESGFQSKNVPKDCKNVNMICEEMPLGWKAKNASKLQYVHNLCPSLVSHVVFASLGPFVYAHAWSLHDDFGSHQVKLVVSHYIRGDVSLSSGAKTVYRNLHKVSRLVKDCLVHPLLATIRSHLGLTTPFSLIGLPPEIQLMIFSQLDATSVAHLSCVCKGIRSVSNDENLWNFFCQRDFGIEETSFSSWKEQYKSLYRQLHAERHQEEDELFKFPHPYPGIPAFNPFLPRRPPRFPSGIIGGPHDVFPDFINVQPQDRRIPQHFPTDTHSAFRRRTGGSANSRSFPH